MKVTVSVTGSGSAQVLNVWTNFVQISKLLLWYFFLISLWFLLVFDFCLVLVVVWTTINGVYRL